MCRHVHKHVCVDKCINRTPEANFRRVLRHVPRRSRLNATCHATTAVRMPCCRATAGVSIPRGHAHTNSVAAHRSLLGILYVGGAECHDPARCSFKVWLGSQHPTPHGPAGGREGSWLTASELQPEVLELGPLLQQAVPLPTQKLLYVHLHLQYYYSTIPLQPQPQPQPQPQL